MRLSLVLHIAVRMLAARMRWSLELHIAAHMQWWLELHIAAHMRLSLGLHMLWSHIAVGLHMLWLLGLHMPSEVHIEEWQPWSMRG
jgi:hypothetical protein